MNALWDFTPPLRLSPNKITPQKGIHHHRIKCRRGSKRHCPLHFTVAVFFISSHNKKKFNKPRFSLLIKKEKGNTPGLSKFSPHFKPIRQTTGSAVGHCQNNVVDSRLFGIWNGEPDGNLRCTIPPEIPCQNFYIRIRTLCQFSLDITGLKIRTNDPHFDIVS
jgi:hypothetical protein